MAGSNLGTVDEIKILAQELLDSGFLDEKLKHAENESKFNNFDISELLFKEFFQRKKIFNPSELMKILSMYENLTGILLKLVKRVPKKIVFMCETAKTGKKSKENKCSFLLVFENFQGLAHLRDFQPIHHSCHSCQNNSSVPFQYRQLRRDIKLYDREVLKLLQEHSRPENLSPIKVIQEFLNKNTLPIQLCKILTNKDDKFRQYIKKPLDNLVNKLKKQMNITNGKRKAGAMARVGVEKGDETELTRSLSHYDLQDQTYYEIDQYEQANNKKRHHIVANNMFKTLDNDFDPLKFLTDEPPTLLDWEDFPDFGGFMLIGDERLPQFHNSSEQIDFDNQPSSFRNLDQEFEKNDVHQFTRDKISFL